MERDIEKKMEKCVSCPPQELPSELENLLQLYPRSTKLLFHIKKTLESRDLEENIRAQCVRLATERTLGDYPWSATEINAAEELALVNCIMNVVYILIDISVRPADAVAIFRCLDNVPLVSAEVNYLEILLYISKGCVIECDADTTDPFVQELVLWFLWYKVKTESPPEAVAVEKLNLQWLVWEDFSCTALEKWSSALKCDDIKVTSRLITALVRFTSPKIDVFTILSSLQLNSPLQAALRPLSERQVAAGFEVAKSQKLVAEYLAVLNVICVHFLAVLEAEKKKKTLFKMAETILAILKCMAAEEKCFIDNALLLARHVIYHRLLFSTDELHKLCELIGELGKVFPFSNEKHSLWIREPIAKFGNSIAPAIKDFQSSIHASAIAEIFMKIMRIRVSLDPTSRESLQLLRSATMFIETALFCETEKVRPMISLSPTGVFELLKVYGPDNIDPLLLVACVSFVKQKDSFLCDCIDGNDPEKFKWIALELYALLRLGADMESILRVQARLREFVNIEHVSEILTVSDLRGKAQNGEDIESELSFPKDNVLVESARRGIVFGVKHKKLRHKVVEELEEIKTALKEKEPSGHEQIQQMERAELDTDTPIALGTLCCGNFIDLYRDIRWPYDNHKRLKEMPYWVLLSTFVFDDLRTAATFCAVNGDYLNQLKYLSCLQLLMSRSRAPKTMIIDNKLRTVEALLFAGCTKNARMIIKKLGPLIGNLRLYSEDFFYLENKLERLRQCVLVEENGPSPPENMTPLTNPVRSPAPDKMRAYSIGRYFQAKAIMQWNLHATGQLVASDCLESCCRNLFALCVRFEDRKLNMTTWESLEAIYIYLVSNSLKADISFDRGAIRDSISCSIEGIVKSQHTISFYFLLRHLERMIRTALRLELSVDSKMSIVSDLIDPKRTEVLVIKEEGTTKAEESFALWQADNIPYKTALFLKMKQYQIDTANRRVPAKEFLKFSKRRNHSRECKCSMCSSIGIDVTLKRIDAVTSCITREKFVPFGSSVFGRIESGIRNAAIVNEGQPLPETRCERIAQDVQITHAFYLSQGFAAEGKFHEALEVLDDLKRLELGHEDALEYCVRKFEYTYQIDWQAALKVFDFHSNSPVKTSTPPNRTCDAFKTPVMIRKTEVKNVQAQRKIRFPIADSESGASSDEDAPEKKIPKKTESDITSHIVQKTRPKRRCVIKTKEAAQAQNVGDEDKPKFVPLDEFSGVTTRRKKNRLDLPRSETATKKIGSVDDLFDDEGETSFVETFARMNFRDRLKKPKQMTQCNAEDEFRILVEAGRRCAPLTKQCLVTDLFQLLAFLSAHRNKRQEFVFYLERSIGISVQLAALNRGAKMSEFFDENIFASDYLEILQPRADFIPNWHERIWKWCDPDWVIVQVSAMMEGVTTPGLLVTRYENGHPPDVVHLSAKHDAQFQGSLLKHYDNLLIINKVSLDKNNRTNYWQKRHGADQLLLEFCGSLENSWISCWKGVFRSEICGPEKQIIDEVFQKSINFAKIHGFQPDERMLHVGLQGLDALKPDELTAMFSKVFGARYDDDVRRVQEFAKSLISEGEREELAKARRKPVILVLDKLLINIPFESCPMFSDVPLTRMPSVPFTMAHALVLKKRVKKNPFALEDPAQGFYVVNPGKDLPNSEERFLAEMRALVDVWVGAHGEPLIREDYRKYLQSKSVYLYSGHGSGRQHMKEHLEVINVRAVVLLLGCSTAKMRRLGTKMDTEGHALRFLIGGSPAVLGNLWDVTDRDIDTFTFSMIRMWLHELFPSKTDHSEPQLGAAVNKSRKECKLRALTGAAPVVFGLPCSSHMK